jgi:penicillin-binding protein 2
MKVNNGEILGMGSAPSFDPSLFAAPAVSPATYRAVFGDPDDAASTLAAPAVNRAAQGAYPTGSTFKPITALAALDSGELELNEIVNDTGSYDPGDGNVLKNAGDAVNGPITLTDALRVSSDVFFYMMGARTNVNEGEGGPIQEWARALGLGEPTGLDLGGEAPGQVPTPAQRNEAFKANTDPSGPSGEQVDIGKGELTDRPWTVGDNINLAIGQGDLQADPLQMAVAYATIANGGEVVRPHVGLRIDDPQGRAIQEIDPPVRRQVEIDPAWQQTIVGGLRDAAMTPGGTSFDIFGGWPVEIAGKTGTAERGLDRVDQAWYVALAPYDDPKYVVAVTIEQGGFGAETAAPATAQILTELLGINEGKIDDVASDGAVYE